MAENQEICTCKCECGLQSIFCALSSSNEVKGTTVIIADGAKNRLIISNIDPLDFLCCYINLTHELYSHMLSFLVLSFFPSINNH